MGRGGWEVGRGAPLLLCAQEVDAFNGKQKLARTLGRYMYQAPGLTVLPPPPHGVPSPPSLPSFELLRTAKELEREREHQNPAQAAH